MNSIFALLLFVGIFSWPMPIVLALSLYTGVSGWTLVSYVLGVEAFWLVILGGFFFIMWADKKRLFH